MTTEQPVGHLQRRRIEGRVLVPFIEVCRETLGEETTRALVAAFIAKASRDDGVRSAERFGGDMAGLRRIAEEVWGGPGGGIDIEVLAQDADRFEFDVTRCGYAELYKQWGLSELGFQLQCSRDHAMLRGFNDDFALERSQTIMQGAACCDFRFRKKTA
jgi:L-2-amino-thiazoline-4-carboxylic acid hydrolase